MNTGDEFSLAAIAWVANRHHRNLESRECQTSIAPDRYDPTRGYHRDERCQEWPGGIAFEAAVTAIG